ncbi:MAG: PrsW family intramembrane metalloprotease [Flavobacteriales bacterium]|nr:PrsW family intramembrane metalloprotease [Flavobacteriales bacterium]
MYLLFILTAIFIAWIWVDYYRLIDIYESEKLKYFIIIFFLGAASVFVVFGLNLYLLDSTQFEMNGEFLQDFIYCVFRIGMLEEFAKLTPFFLACLFFKKELNEPIDYVSYICIGALGFSAAENVLYFSNYGAHIISGRSILSTVGHMMFAAFTAYGIILYKYKRNKYGIFIILFYFFVGSLSHGIYDFWLMHPAVQPIGYIITVLFFLESISLFATILNNALNNSTFFSYKFVVNTDQVTKRLIFYYVIVFGIQFSMLLYDRGLERTISSIGFNTFLTAFIVGTCSFRFSRFKLIKGRWFPLKLQLPIYYRKVNLYSNKYNSYRLGVRGERYNEVYLNNYYEEYLWLNPLSRKGTYLKTSKKAFIERKIFLNRDETYYITKLYLDSSETRYEYILLKPKLVGKRFTQKKYPIVAVLQVKEFVDFENPKLNMNDFKFLEWAYPRNYENLEKA